MSDYIDREDAKKWLTNLIDDCGKYQDMWHYAEALEQIIKLLGTDVAPVRHGRWITEPYMDNLITCRCSECMTASAVTLEDNKLRFNYCPNCGAKMDEEE